MRTDPRTNGIQEGERNAQIFLNWLHGVKDFTPYIRNGRLSVARVAREVGLNRDVFYTNPTIRDAHWPALNNRLLEEGILGPRVGKALGQVKRTPPPVVSGGAEMKRLEDELRAVKTENGELRRRLEKYRAIEEILHTTGRLPW